MCQTESGEKERERGRKREREREREREGGRKRQRARQKIHRQRDIPHHIIMFFLSLISSSSYTLSPHHHVLPLSYPEGAHKCSMLPG